VGYRLTATVSTLPVRRSFHSEHGVFSETVVWFLPNERLFSVAVVLGKTSEAEFYQ
jgi:hypothetical protein